MSDVPPADEEPLLRDDAGEPIASEPRDHRVDADEPLAMPRWVPIVIGLVLITIAGLAVYTGMRYRNNALVGGTVRQHSTTRGVGSGPPGEPGPGASLIFPGESGDNTPAAHETLTGRTRADISGGGPGGVVSSLRLNARRGMMTRVVPEDAVIYVNDIAIGEAKQFNSQDEVYDFASPGSYTVRIVAPGFHDRQFVVTAGETARNELAVIDVKLEPVIK